jgi:hypothetical protein
MRDMREGVCALCAHQEILEVIPGEFVDGGMERPAAATYKPRWMLDGRNPSHPVGLLRRYVCRHCGYSQTFVLEPGEIPLEAGYKASLIRGPGAASSRTGPRQRLETRHAALYLHEEGLEQEWPSGAVHRILWGSPFAAHLHRAPDQSWRGPVVDIHLRLVQQRQDATDTVALTLCLEDAPKLRSLPPLVALLPRLEGEQAASLLAQVRRALAMHGQRLSV